LKIFKFIANDYFIFLLNMSILGIIYINFFYINYITDIWTEMAIIAICYYVISVIVTVCIVFFLYTKVACLFSNTNYTIFKKLEIISYLFDVYYEEVNNTDDFELRIKEYLSA